MRVSSLMQPAACLLLACGVTAAEIPAFPGAEGFGKLARGGRGGDVYHVVNLNDAGPGSLRDALETVKGPRTVVFDVGGTIQLKKALSLAGKSNVTIAGQTAPGKGITLRDHGFTVRESRDIVIRFLRVRLGDENKPTEGGEDCMTLDRNENIILDHLSLSWGIDGNSDYRANAKMTLQWLIYSEALNESVHPKGAHAMCTSIRDCKGDTSVHHNIYATSRHRHPTLGGGSGVVNPDALIDFRNCVNYNWSGPTNIGGMKINIVNNFYRPGPMTDTTGWPMQMKDNNLDKARGYASGNIFERLAAGFTKDNYSAVLYTNRGNYASTTRERWAAEKEFETGAFAIQTQSSKEAYDSCLRFSGSSLVRDTADERLVRDILAGKGRVLNSQNEVGGWDPYPEIRRKAGWDSDGDGMPDEWEKQHGLNARNAEDGKGDRDGDGYTNLEEYLNDLAQKAFPAGLIKVSRK